MVSWCVFPMARGRRTRLGRPRKRRRDYHREWIMSQQAEKQPVGPPPGSQNGLSHGIIAFKNRANRIGKRGKSVIDQRTTSGQNAIAMRNDLIQERGGTDNLSVAQLAMIEMVA